MQPATCTCEIVAAAPGRMTVSGALTFDTARRAHETGAAIIAASDAQAIEVDCAGLSDSDSAGLVVLLDWLAAARRNNRELRFTHLPDTMRAVAEISGIEGLFAPAGA